MFRRRYKAAAISAGLLVMASSMPVAAAGNLTLVNEFEKNGAKVYVLAGEGCELPELNLPNWPDQPETETPDNDQSDQPETETPDNGQPDRPETEAPDNDQPDQPETETPDNDQPDQPENQSFAVQVINLVNQERAREGLPALTYDAKIETAALVRARETEISFSHTRPDGRSFSTALTDAGAVFRGSGENIAYGQRSPEQVMEGWMNSPGHRANIMNEKFTKIGVGYYQNSNGVNYWTQLFTY